MASMKRNSRMREVSTTTGTGTYTLGGSPTGYQPFSVIGSGNYCAYYATDGVDWEEGLGTYSSGPDRLARTAVLASSNAGAAVDWDSGSKIIRCAPSAVLDTPRLLSKSVAGSSNVTLTADEQRRRMLVFTGALTGSINVIVDDTVDDWIVYNATSGAYTLTIKTSGGTGIEVFQGSRLGLHCDGTNVVVSDFSTLFSTKGDLLVASAVHQPRRLAVGSDLALLVADSSASYGVKWGTAGQIGFPATQNASAGANVLDDYEEGTFTPSVNFGGGTTGITYTFRGGQYTKIGRFAKASCSILLSNKGSSTGNANISGYPVTWAQPSFIAPAYWSNLATTFYSVNVRSSSASVDLYGQSAASATSTQLTDTEINNTTALQATVCGYE